VRRRKDMPPPMLRTAIDQWVSTAGKYRNVCGFRGTGGDMQGRWPARRDAGGRAAARWHASPGIPSGSPRRRENPGQFPLSAGGLAVAG